MKEAPEACIHTNPNPKVRNSGAVVGKAVLASMVLESAGYPPPATP